MAYNSGGGTLLQPPQTVVRCQGLSLSHGHLSVDFSGSGGHPSPVRSTPSPLSPLASGSHGLYGYGSGSHRHLLLMSQSSSSSFNSGGGPPVSVSGGNGANGGSNAHVECSHSISASNASSRYSLPNLEPEELLEEVSVCVTLLKFFYLQTLQYILKLD